jgi:hypothetical protein
MNPQTIRNPTQLYKVREAYLANLELEQRNLQKTSDAVSVFKTTGQVPLAPQDTRSVNEKLGDIEKLKISLRKQLMTITDGQQTSDIMNALSNDEIQALSIVFGNVADALKTRYANGVPAPIFLEYVRRYLKDYGTNIGLASGNQGVLAEELKLTRDMMMRTIPSPPIMQELMRAIDLAPDSKEKTDAIEAVSQLSRSLPNIDDITSAQTILSEVELANLSSLITDALQTVPSAAQVQKLSKEIIDTLRSGSKKETENILSKTLNTIKIENEELAQLNSISEALKQEQAESLVPRPTMPNIPPSVIEEIARIVGSRVRTVQTATGEKRITRTGKEVFVTVPETKLIEKGTLTARDREVAQEIFALDYLNETQIAANNFSKAALTKYWDYVSKRDNGVGLTIQELENLASLTKDELKQRIMDGKTAGELSFVIQPKPKANKIEKKAEQQSTASQIGGISAGAQDILARAEADIDAKRLMEIAEFETLDMDKQMEYAYQMYAQGVLDPFPDLKDRADQLFRRTDPKDWKANTIPDLYASYKTITGLGMKKKATQRSKAQNIVFGCGLTKSVNKKKFVEKIDYNEGLPVDKSYIPFGKYVIHKHKLTGGILQVRTVKGGSIPKLPTLGISPSLGKIIKKMVGGGLPTYDEMSALNEDEKNTLYKVFKLSNIDKADMLPSPDKTKEEQEMNRFQILKGQIQSGNDSAELIKEFKCILMRFISGGKIPRGQGMDIVCELMALGF